MRSGSRSQPQRVGPWVLIRKINGGGNADVYEAARDGRAEHVALKVIRTQKADREPYQRFAREVGFLRTLTIEDGVLPLLDANVPTKPTKTNQAWLAMPIAEPIRDALAGASLETIVDAVATLAETLARLASQGVAHRDIKPGNLYRLDDRWLVGDFGLIDTPDLEQLTLEGRPLGPAHFTAHELIAAAATTDDARPADVYSLAKTLWVLAAEQRYPPEGHQAAGTSGFGIADMRPHRHADQLDRLIDAMTQLRHELRPTMAQVATDLRQWLEMDAEQPGLSIDEIRARVRSKLQPELDQLDLQDRRLGEAQAARTRILSLVDPLNLELRSIHPKALLDKRYDDECDGLFRSQPSLGRPPAVFNWYTVSSIQADAEVTPFELKFGCGIELDRDGNLGVRTVIIGGRRGVMGNRFLWMGDLRTAPVGSIATEQNMRLAVEELFSKFPEGLEYFHRHLPSSP
jgi:serine/threonine protein kinase